MNSKGKDPLQLYLRELEAVPPLTKNEERDVFQNLRVGGHFNEAAARRLIETHLRLVVDIAERHRPVGVGFLQLIEKGNQALMQAIETFEGSSEESFKVHASACIEDAISKATAE